MNREELNETLLDSVAELREIRKHIENSAFDAYIEDEIDDETYDLYDSIDTTLLYLYKIIEQVAKGNVAGEALHYAENCECGASKLHKRVKNFKTKKCEE